MKKNNINWYDFMVGVGTGIFSLAVAIPYNLSLETSSLDGLLWVYGTVGGLLIIVGMVMKRKKLKFEIKMVKKK